MLGAEEFGESLTFGICGNWKLAALESSGRMTGDALGESVPVPDWSVPCISEMRV